MTHYRIRRKRAKIDRKRVRIQRRDEKSRRHDDECLVTAEEKNNQFASVAKGGRLIPTSWRLRKGNINA